MSEYLIGIYKEVGKNPTLKKIKNYKSELEKLIGGEIEKITYDDYIIVYKKNSDNMLANICIEPKGYGLGISLKGKIFAINQNENEEFKSLTKEQATRIDIFFRSKHVNYEKFDEKGRYLPLMRRRKKADTRNSKLHQKELQNQKSDTNNGLKTEGIENSKEILLELIKSIEKDMYTISFSDKSVLKMILKIQFIILEFLNKGKKNIKE